MGFAGVSVGGAAAPADDGDGSRGPWKKVNACGDATASAKGQQYMEIVVEQVFAGAGEGRDGRFRYRDG